MIVGHAIFTDRANVRGCKLFCLAHQYHASKSTIVYGSRNKKYLLNLLVYQLKRSTDHNYPFYIANNKQEWYKPKDDKLIFIEKVEEMKWSVADQFGAKFFPGCCHKPTSKLDAWLMINGKKCMEEFVNNTN